MSISRIYPKIYSLGSLTFNDLIDERSGFVYSTSEIREGGRIQDFNIDGGVLLYHKRFFLGYGLQHINGPNNSFLGESVLPILNSIQAGVKQSLGEKGMINWIHSTKNQSELTVSLTSLQVRYGYFLFGAGYSFNNIKNLRIGVTTNHFRIHYLHEINSINLGSNAFSNELALQILLNLTNNNNELPVSY